MMNHLRRYRSSIQAHADPGIFLPLFFTLALIGVMSAFQSNTLPGESPSGWPFVRLVVSRVLWFWYFIPLALVIQGHTRRIRPARRTVFRWLGVHAATLTGSFILHEALSLGIESALEGKPAQATFYTVLNNPSVWIEILVYALLLLGFYLIDYRRISMANEAQCIRIEAELVKSKLQELRSRIQPAILFQTLETLQALVRGGKNGEANEILAVFGDVLRITVYESEREEVPLEQELHFLRQYLILGNCRWNRQAAFEARTDAAIIGCAVPQFLLQPIVEQMLSRVPAEDSARGPIILDAVHEGDRLRISVEDRRSGLSPGSAVPETSGEIWTMTRERLQQLYGENHLFDVRQTNGGGLSVGISLPYHYPTDERAVVYSEVNP